MAQRSAESKNQKKERNTAAKAGKPARTKAQQATEKREEELLVERRNSLWVRLGASILLVFLALFLILSLFRVHGVFLDAFGSLMKGLLGYGFVLTPIAFLFMAWMLFFLHEEPIRSRMISTALFVPVFSALAHTVACRIIFEPGLSMIRSLWSTGGEFASGGVIPGLVSLALQALISRGGTVPLLIVALLVLLVFMFNISPAKIIHDRAEKRREQLAELEDPEEDPAPVYDTRADLRVLATPAVKQRVEWSRRQKDRDFDLAFGDGEEPGEDNGSPLLDDDDELFPFRKKKKKEKKTASPFDIDMPGTSYSEQIRALTEEKPEPEEEPMPLPWERPGPVKDAWEPEPADNWTTPAVEPVAEPMKMIPEAELTEAAVAAMKDQKVSHDEARMAAAQVAMEIESQVDQEAREEKPAYQFPPMSMLAEALESKEDNTEEMRSNVLRLEETLESFGVDSKINNVVRGPAVTRYEMELKPGVKMNKITSLHEDIALSLGVTSVHVAAVPGKSSTIGIEVPNSIVTSVPIKEVLDSKEFKSHKSTLAFAVGKDISGNYIIGDIDKMPHLLIAGTTGSGKSVCMNGIIVSLLYRDSPEDCRLIMIDPKVVELSVYNGVPHLLIPVVTDAKKAAGALQWAVTEMDRRYDRFAEASVRNLAGYNKKAETDPELEPMSRIVIIIDELADLMMVAAKEVETNIARLAAKARAAGMHLVIATQRPSADVITGVIKANIPSRIAFAVSSAMESNIIMGTRGAEKLLGKGDMFYAPQGADKPRRVQGCFISDEEVEKVAEFVKNASETDYSEEIISEIEQNAATSSGSAPAEDEQLSLLEGEGDPLLADAVEVILDTKQASVSMLQRRLKLGYAHAARIVDEMEEKGIVGPFEGSKPRQLLITREQWAAMVGINPRATVDGPPAEEAPAEDDVPFDEDE